MKDLDDLTRDEGFLSEIINAITSGIFVTDLQQNILMINKPGAKMVGKRAGECFDRKCYEIFNTPLCNTPDCPNLMARENKSINRGQTILHFNDQEIPIEYTARPLRNYQGDIIGCVENFIDISDRLDKDRIILEQKEKLIRKREEDIRHLQDEIMELSTPVIEIWDGILTLPLIGTLDSHRAKIAMQRVLEAIERSRASFVIIDITGVPAVDSEVAGHILQTANATRLMGSQAILTGVGPHIAQIIAQEGVGLENLTVRGRMTDALHYAIGQLARKEELVARATALIGASNSND
ncbi:MAG: PAS domain-containing protein [Deltaproteobacteria bacterium]|nr:PAS domain-containing protein [Deltaproteobacteria bacterium]